MFERAVGRDSKFAEAYVGMADCYDRLADATVCTLDLLANKAALEKTLELDEKLAEAHDEKSIVKLPKRSPRWVLVT